VEKLQVLGRDDIASPLEELLPYIRSQDANIEVLTLLLALSDRPVDGAVFDADKFIVVKEAGNKEITWEEILAEEPFVGEHWREPEYAGSDEDSDWVFEAGMATAVKESPMVGDEGRLEEVSFGEGTKKEAEQVLERQYWLRRKKFTVIHDESISGSDDGGTTSFWGRF
jgi:hypothetical protein